MLTELYRNHKFLRTHSIKKFRLESNIIIYVSTLYLYYNKKHERIMSFKNKRLHARVNMREKVLFGEDVPNNIGVSHNLSPDGICIIALVSLIPQSSIILNIHLDTDRVSTSTTKKIISIEGRVVWASKLSEFTSIMGIKFNRRNEKLLQIYYSKLNIS